MQFQFWHLNATPLAQPQEWQTCLIELPNADLSDTVYLQADNVLTLTQRHFAGAVRLLAECPRLGPGHYRLTHNNRSQIFTVESSKLTQADLQQLLQDLNQHLPAALTQHLQHLQAFSDSQWQPVTAPLTPLAALQRLQHAVFGDAKMPGLVQLLPAINARPQHTLQMAQHTVLLARARHCTQQVLTQMKPPQPPATWPTYVTVQQHRPSLDTAENQLINLYLHQVQQQLRTLPPFKQPLPRQAVQTLTHQLNQLRQQATWLAAVSLPNRLPDLSPVLAKQPYYRAVLNSYLRFRQTQHPIFQDPTLQQPLNQLPYLYQVWGTLQLIQQLLALAITAGYVVQQQQLCQPQNGSYILQVLPTRFPIVHLLHPQQGQQVRVWVERSYTTTLRSGFSSISRLQRPDIVLEVLPRQGQPRLYIFDPKYRLEGGEQPSKADLDRMHAYRDAIRYQQQRVVCYAAILYPGSFYSYGSQEVEALPARPTAVSALQQSLQTILQQALALQDET